MPREVPYTVFRGRRVGKRGGKETHERDIEGGREAEEEEKNRREDEAREEMRREEQKGMAAMQGSRMTGHSFALETDLLHIPQSDPEATHIRARRA